MYGDCRYNIARQLDLDITLHQAMAAKRNIIKMKLGTDTLNSPC